MSGQKKKQQLDRLSESQKPQSPPLVKMVSADGKPADVHPSEVDNYKAGGYKAFK